MTKMSATPECAKGTYVLTNSRIYSHRIDEVLLAPSMMC